MYPDLQKELTTFERRTPKSAEAHKKNLKRIPLGVASNYRAYDPWPIFVKIGGSNANGDEGIKDVEYTEVLQWDQEVTPVPNDKTTYPKVIIDAPPAGKSLLNRQVNVIS